MVFYTKNASWLI